MGEDRKWTRDEFESAVSALRLGLTVQQLAEQLGRSEKSVRQKMNHEGVCLTDIRRQTIRNIYYNANVQCPFFDSFTHGRSITCEGIISCTVVINKFANEGEWKKHMTKFCNNDYKNCPVAKKLFEKYP